MATRMRAPGEPAVEVASGLVATSVFGAKAAEAELDPVEPLVIEADGAAPLPDVRELWGYRGLLWFLVRRDVKVRYAQSVMGMGWAVIQPVFTMIVFTVVFGGLAGVPSDGVPYAAFSLAALVPWSYFAAGLTGASNSLVGSANLITKVYFPRLVIPLTPVLAGLVDFGIGLVLMLAVLLAFGIVPSPAGLLVVPLLTGGMMLVAAGVGFWLSALNIHYRDVRHVVPFLVQIWMYASPVVYPLSLVPERFRLLYALNPMVGVIEGFRAVLLGTRAVGWGPIALSFVVGMVLFVSGAVYFRRAEELFADLA